MFSHLKPIDYIGIDNTIVPLIKEINSNQYFITTLSCAGHYAICMHHHRKIVDDFNLGNFSSDIPNHFCDGTSQPFIQFRCDLTQICVNTFIDDLSHVPSNLATFHIKNDYVSYAYGNGDEGYRERIDDLNGHRFEKFWQYFTDCWEKNIDKIHKSILPVNFPLNPENKCCQCGKKDLNPDSTLNCTFNMVEISEYLDVNPYNWDLHIDNQLKLLLGKI
jgi:hypothetical protein